MTHRTRRIDIDVNRRIVAQRDPVDHPGRTYFRIQNGVGFHNIALTDEAMNALIRVYMDIREDEALTNQAP